jgi:competence protein CoiA
MYSPEGEELHFGGYAYFSKKWRELTLQGPYPPERIRLTIARRPAWQTERYRLPQCRIVQFVVDGADVPE